MSPFFFTINSDMPVMVIPDTQAHMDGHPVVTYSYTLYRSQPGESEFKMSSVDKLLSPDKVKRTDYLGTLYFEQPYKSFSYTADGLNELDIDDVQQIIDMITAYRMNPEVWPKQF